MSGYTIKETKDKGRSMFASQPFKIGDTIFEEKPFVSCQFAWNRDYKYLACDHCLKPLETSESNVRRLTGILDFKLPYSQCCSMAGRVQQLAVVCPHCAIQYCSENCRIEAAQSYHFALCLKDKQTDAEHPANKLMDAWKKIHYPPETTTIALLVRLLGMYMQSPDKSAILASLKDFQSKVVNEDLMIAHKMLGPNFESQLAELYPMFCKLFEESASQLSEFLTPQAFKTFFAIIGTNGQGIGTSAFADWVRNVTAFTMPEDDREVLNCIIDDLYEKLDDVTGLQFLNNEGSALYLTQSKINHDCNPNAEPTFPWSNHVLAIKAIRDIDVGEEVTISYLDECFLERSRHSRQKELQENYLFVCHCAKCEDQANDSDVTTDEELDEDMEE